MGFDQPSLKGRALRLLAGREHSRAELERKLKPHETEPGELARALDELQAKGVSAEAVATAVADLQGSEFERAREIWRRKFGEPAADAAGQAKQMRFLATRGFGGDVIRKVVGGRHED